MSCNHLSPARAVRLSANLSFPPPPPPPRCLLPHFQSKGSKECAHLVQSTGHHNSKAIGEEKEALTVDMFLPSKGRGIFHWDMS